MQDASIKHVLHLRQKILLANYPGHWKKVEQRVGDSQNNIDLMALKTRMNYFSRRLND